MKHTRLQQIILLSIATVGFLFVLGAAFPGFMTSDSIDQYQQALKGVYTDWHPPFLAWVWHQLLMFRIGPEPMLVLNLTLYWISIVLLSFQMRRFILALLFSILAFSPPLINFIGVIWKDVLLFSILFIECVILLYISEHSLKKQYKVPAFALILGLSLSGMLIRYNAAPAIVPLLAAAIYFLFTPQKLLLSLGLSLICCSILFWGSGSINNRICQGRHLYPIQQLMLYDLMGIAKKTGENTFPGYLEKKINTDTLAKVYSPLDGAMVAIFDLRCRTNLKEDVDSLKKVWQAQILKHPGALVLHKLDNYSKLLAEPGLCTFRNITENNEGLHLKVCPLLNKIFVGYTEHRIARKTYKPLYYLVLCLVVFTAASIGYVVRRNTRQALVLLIALSGILYSVFYFFLSPCNDFRYHYWTIGAAFISLFLWLNTVGKKK